MLFVVVLMLVPTFGVSAQGPAPTPPSPSRLVPPPAPDAAAEPKVNPTSDLDKPGVRLTSPTVRTAVTRSRIPILGQAGFSLKFDQSFGIAKQAYPDPGTGRVNAPGGLFVDAGGNVYVTEDRGYRVLRYTSAGVNNLSLGKAGYCEMLQSPAGFCTPQDVALDAGGNLWIADGNRIAKYGSTGTYIEQLPVPSDGAWKSGADNTHFGFVTGVAINTSANLMFVADSSNHRVQVYSIATSPVYSTTLGVTGVPGSDDAHFSFPRRMAVDTLGNLFVVDSGNNRVQQCTLSTSWMCSTYATGLSDPQGIALDSANNVYIADSKNSRLLKCTAANTCAQFSGTMPGWISDVAVDSTGTVYVSDWTHSLVRKYDSAGTLVGPFVGTVDTPYVTDAVSLNSPWGIAVAADGSIYVAESNGNRLIKLNASGAQVWTVGQAGVIGPFDDAHFAGPQGSLALDSDGKVYIPDTQNFRIQVYKKDGTWIKGFGGDGTGPSNLRLPSGVAINRVNGNIYVADRGNERVQVYTSAWNYVATLGTTGVEGVDGTHFKTPYGVAVDSTGKVYVADADNHRVQKCTISGASGTCVTIVGVTGERGTDFDHLDYPTGLAIDGYDRLYIADRRNSRVQVFTVDGAYLTTIGGSWGDRTGQMRSPSGVAIDASGNLWVSDVVNNRIEKFSIGVQDWEQKNINGFGDPDNIRITALATFADQLYAGTYNKPYNKPGAARVYRQKTDGGWEAVNTPGFGNAANVGVDHLLAFGGNLYAGTWSDDTNGGEIWRTNNGTTWSKVVAGGFGDVKNAEIPRLAAFNNQLYASTASSSHGAEIWRSPSGNTGTWTRVAQNGFGNGANSAILSFEVFNGYLYAGTLKASGGGEIWRCQACAGSDWTQVNGGGLSGTANRSITALAAFGTYLYAGVQNATAGSEIWRCQTCTGSDWTQVMVGGFGDAKNNADVGLEVLPGMIFATTTNSDTGMKVWKSTTGASGTWTETLSPAGFGDNNNLNGYYDNALTSFDNRLYTGTRNGANGGEIWRFTTPFNPSPTPPPPDPTPPPPDPVPGSNSLYLPYVTR